MRGCLLKIFKKNNGLKINIDKNKSSQIIEKSIKYLFS